MAWRNNKRDLKLLWKGLRTVGVLGSEIGFDGCLMEEKCDFVRFEGFEGILF
jgi:hypothetical protein